MSTVPLPRLLLFDVPTGPRPAWYLPRLCSAYELHILWVPGPDPGLNRARAALFDEWCTHATIPGHDTAADELTGVAKARQPAGILGFGEMSLEPVHIAAARLGLPANAPRSLAAIRNKHEQRRLLAEAGIPTPRFASVRDLDELRAAARRVGLPAVLKPKAGVGSLATFRVDGTTDLAGLWSAACAGYAADPRGGSVPDFVLEEFLVGVGLHGDPRYGTYASVESLVRRGTVRHLAVTDKFPLSPGFRENGGIMPSVLPDTVLAPLLDCASRAIHALGITDSGVHTEIMFTRDGPRVIEVNSRIGGGVTEMLHHCCSFDSVLACAAIATGGEPPEFSPPARSTAFLLPQAPHQDTVLTAAPTVDALLALPGVVEAELPYTVGDRPRWRQGTPGGTMARVVAVADSAPPLLDLFADLQPGGLLTYRAVRP
ncbi:hypothetical protein [Kitasatospora sp. NPDC005856]|uniref:ATP-grasp domain-containing protein n=1 Tax=Kitasatospora sp. NPDC005856 TaxID=3154566 RepID=UPI0033F61459